MTETSSASTLPRAAVIGLGRMGVRHLEALRTIGMPVVGLADVSSDSLQAAAQAAGIAADACFSDAVEMLTTVRPEAVVIATTAPSHAALVLEAAASGARYILCEKPLSSSLTEAEEMAEACRRAGASLAVNHQMRFMPNYTHIKSLIQDGRMGPLVSMVVSGSNFGLAMNASHYFEAFRWLTGSDVVSVAAQFEPDLLPNPRGPQFIDRSGRLLATGQNGEGLYIDFSANAGWGLQVTYIFRLGQVCVDELNGEVRTAVRQAEFRDQPTSRYGLPVDITQEAIPPAETVESTMAVWRAMFANEGYPDIHVGEHALRCLVAAHISAGEHGRPVSTDIPVQWRQEKFAWA